LKDACLHIRFLFQVPTAANIKITVFWDIGQCCFIEVDWRFRGAYCLHNRPDDGGSIHLWHIGLLQRDYTALYYRSLQSSYISVVLRTEHVPKLVPSVSETVCIVFVLQSTFHVNVLQITKVLWTSNKWWQWQINKILILKLLFWKFSVCNKHNEIWKISIQRQFNTAQADEMAKQGWTRCHCYYPTLWTVVILCMFMNALENSKFRFSPLGNTALDTRNRNGSRNNPSYQLIVDWLWWGEIVVSELRPWA
jgi:hypothetical protein